MTSVAILWAWRYIEKNRYRDGQCDTIRYTGYRNDITVYRKYRYIEASPMCMYGTLHNLHARVNRPITYAILLKLHQWRSAIYVRNVSVGFGCTAATDTNVSINIMYRIGVFWAFSLATGSRSGSRILAAVQHFWTSRSSLKHNKSLIGLDWAFAPMAIVDPLVTCSLN